MAHTWWHSGPIGPGQSREETKEFYEQWADIQRAMNPDQSYLEGNWLAKILGAEAQYSGGEEADAYVAGRQAEALRESLYGEDLPEYGPDMEEEVFAPGSALAAPEKGKGKKTSSTLEKLFLYELLSNMRGGDVGQAPAVVAGGGRREFPTMMRQFSPWEREKPYWWLR
jgi:hypothetical protein